MLSNVLEAIRIIINPSTRIQTDIPWSVRIHPDSKADLSGSKADSKTDVHVTPSGLIFNRAEFCEDGNRIFELEKADVHTDIQGRKSGLTADDKRMIRSKVRHPDFEKAAILKPLWASGLSASQAASSFTGRGYGKRTIAGYFAAFSAALSGEGLASKSSAN